MDAARVSASAMRTKNRILLLLVCLAYVAFGLVTAVIGVVISRFQQTYRVPLWIAGLLPFAFYLAYGICSIPFGLLMDRKGGRPVILLGMFLMTLGCFLFYSGTHWWLIIIIVFIIGVGVTAIQTAGNPIIRDLDIPSRYTSNLTIIIGIGALGYAISPVMIPYFELKGYSWQTVYLVFGIVNLVLLLLLVTVRFPPAKPTEDEKVRPEIMTLLLKDPIIITYTLGIFLYVGGEVGVSSYIVTYMEQVHKMGLQDSIWAKDSFWYDAFPSASALAVALFWALQALGRMIIGLLMNIMKPKAIFVVCSGLCVASLLVALLGSSHVALISFVFTGLFTCASFTLLFSAAVQSFEANHGTISGILCTAIIGGAILSGLVGVVGQAWGLRMGMAINLIAFVYVFLLAALGRGKLDVEAS